MTYKHLIKYLEDHARAPWAQCLPKNIPIADSRLVFIVGENPTPTAELLRSILNERKITYFSYSKDGTLVLKDRFLKVGAYVAPREIAAASQRVLDRAHEPLNSEQLCCFTALALADAEDYVILEMSAEHYSGLAGQSGVDPYAVIFCEPCETASVHGAREIVTPTDEDNFDYISSTASPLGARISYVSPNKILIGRSDAFNTEFYYHSDKFNVKSRYSAHIPLVALAIEAARAVFGINTPYIARGIENAPPKIKAPEE